MKLNVVDGIKIILPCKLGDLYYTIDRVSEISREIRYDAWSGETQVMESAKMVGGKIVEHKWNSYAEIVQALETGRVGKNIFLESQVAKSKFEKYWEK